MASNENLIRALLFQADLYRTMDTSVDPEFLTRAAGNIGRGFVNLGTQIKENRERAAEEKDRDTISGAIEEGLTPREVLALRTNTRSGTLLKIGMSKTLSDIKARESKGEEPVGTGFWRLLDKKAKGIPLSPAESIVFKSKIREESAVPVKVTLPVEVSNELGRDPSETFELPEAINMMNIVYSRRRLERGESEEFEQGEEAIAFANMVNELLSNNPNINFPKVEPAAVEDPSHRPAILNLIARMHAETRRVTEAERLAEYRDEGLALRERAIRIREAEWGEAVRKAKDTAAEREVEAIRAELSDRLSFQEQLLMPVQEQLNEYPDLKRRYERATEAGKEAREEAMSGERTTKPTRTPAGESKDDDYYREFFK